MGGPRATFDDSRRCNRCKDVKPLSEFYKGQYACKSCNPGKNREYARKQGVPEKRKRDLSLTDRGLKECFRCDKVLPMSDFSPTSRGIGGVAAYCKPCISRYQLERRKRDPEGYKVYLKEYRQSEGWKEAHRGHQRKRKAVQLNQDTGRVTLGFLRVLYATETCHYCNQTTPRKNRTMDHKTPLSRGGLHDPDNLVMACGSCNSSKRDLTEEEFKKRGILSKNLSR